jgi:hypothetical protein
VHLKATVYVQTHEVKIQEVALGQERKIVEVLEEWIRNRKEKRRKVEMCKEPNTEGDQSPQSLRSKKGSKVDLTEVVFFFVT